MNNNTYLIFIDDIKKAQKKLKKCEVSSDIQLFELSDFDIENEKRKRLTTKKWSSASSSDNEDESNEHRLIEYQRKIYLTFKTIRIATVSKT